MEAALAQQPRCGSRSDREAELSVLVVELRSELATLRREVALLRQEVGYWKSMHARVIERNRELEAEMDLLRAENRKLKDRLFGCRTEKAKPNDRCNHLADPQEESEASPRQRGHQPDQPGALRRDYSHLPVVEETIALLVEECVCPKCGKPREEMTETEDSEVIEIEVRAHCRRIRRKRYRATCDCPGVACTITAPPLPKLIPKSRYGISLWVHVLLSKFGLHRATSNLIEELKQCDLDLPPGTVNGGLRRLEPLFESIYEAFLERNAQSRYRQADETRWPVFVEKEGKKGHRWWLWAFLGEDTVVFRIAATRGHKVPEEHYAADVRAFLMVDRYSAYKAMVQVKSGVVILVFCWAHVRRDFIEVGKGWPELADWALSWLQRIREIYHLNRQRLKHDRGSAEFQQHDLALRETMAAMQQQAQDELAERKLREPCRKTLESLQTHWPGLVVFVHDPKIPMDNNASERTVRGPAMGRKNYYGSGSLWSVSLAAAMFSILATLKRWNINPHRWLTWYLESCAAAGSKPPTDIESFLPWNLSDQRRRELAHRASSAEPTDTS